VTLEQALALVRRLDAPGPLYLVGGFLRDLKLGRASRDIDLATAGASDALARKAARVLGGKPVLIDADHGLWRVMLKSGPAVHLDIARMEGGTIEKDLARRDFTMNAMAVPAVGGERWVDPFGGQKDLEAGLIRMVSVKAFTDDGLRLLRAFRFASELGLKIEPATLKAIGAKRKSIAGSAGERVQHELLRLLEGPAAADCVREMEACGLLTALMPELSRLRRCARVYYGEAGVMGHSLQVLSRLEGLLGKLPEVYPDLEPQLRAHLENRDTPAASYAALLKLTALIHDIAKPATARPIGGRLRFFGHEELGAVMSDKLLDRLRFSRDQRRAVAQMIRFHLRPGNLAANPTVSDKAVYRFFDELREEGVGLLLVCWADYASYLTDPQLKKVLSLLKRDPRQTPNAQSLAPDLRKTHRHLQVVGILLHAWFRRRKTVAPPRLVDGNDVIKTVGLAPGPEIGKILKTVREQQAEGKLSSRDEILTYLKGLKK